MSTSIKPESRVLVVLAIITVGLTGFGGAGAGWAQLRVLNKILHRAMILNIIIDFFIYNFGELYKNNL